MEPDSKPPSDKTMCIEDETDRVPPRLRQVEREIDTAYLVNPLTRRPFAEAAWYFLAHCEDLLVKEFVRGDQRKGESPNLAMLTDTLVVHPKHALLWLHR